MTLAEILAMFRDLSDDVGSPPLWSDATLMRFLCEAQIEACRRSRLLEDRDTDATCLINVAANTSIYGVDPRVLFIRRVKASWDDRPLAKIDPRDLDRIEPGWEDAQSVDQPRWWMPWGQNSIRIEKPVGTGTIRLWVVRDPLETPHSHVAAPVSVTTLTRVGNVATVVLAATPTVPPEIGDYVTIAGATDAKWNGTHRIDAVTNATTFSYHVAGNPVTPAAGTITADIVETGLEVPPRYHAKLVDWMLYRALSMRDKEEKYDPKSAEHHLGLFEQEFGRRSSAIDETWIRRAHGYDDHEGLF